MSFLGVLSTNVEDLWKSVAKRTRRSAILERRIANLERELGQVRTLIGEAAYGPFSYSVPPFLVQIDSQLSTGIWAARRLLPTVTGIVLDDEDEEFFEVRTTPWATGMFVGARGWVQHTHNSSSDIPELNNLVTAIYSTMDGEWGGFAGQTTGEPIYDGGVIYYPWTQVGTLPSDHYDSGTVIGEGESAVTLGPAQYITQAGYDVETTTFERVELDAGTPCWIWFDLLDGEFKMIQMSERKVFECPA